MLSGARRAYLLPLFDRPIGGVAVVPLKSVVGFGVEMSMTGVEMNATGMWSCAFDRSSQLGDWDMSMDGGEKDDALEVLQAGVMVVSDRLKNGIGSFHVIHRGW
jgi:hypothetical protein